MLDHVKWKSSSSRGFSYKYMKTSWPPFLALELKQKVHGVACLNYAGSEHRLTIGLQFSAVVVEADTAKIPTPDLMEEVHLTPDSMRDANCDFTVQDFHF